MGQIASSSSGLHRAWAALSLLALALPATGCSGEQGQPLKRWSFDVDGRSVAVELPVHLDAELPKKVLVYRLTGDVVIDAPLRSRPLDLVLARLPSRVTLRVDGQPVRSAYTSQLEGYRHVGPHRWSIPAAASADGRLHLELAVTHSWTQSAWVDVAPRLVPAGTQTKGTATNYLLNEIGAWFGLFGLSQMGLTFLAVYFWDRRRRAYLWFAIQALTASYYPAYVLGLTIPLGPAGEHLLLAQSLSVAPIISVYYTHDFFERGRPSRIWLVLFVVGILVPLPAMFDRFINSAYGTPGVILCVGAAIAYQVTVGVRLVGTYADRGIGLFFLCCWLALGGSAWVDLWAWLGGGEVLDGARPACVGLGLFGLFQSLLLSRSLVRSMREADSLNASLLGRLSDLEQRQAEINALNEELRQQVGRRSAQILTALAGAVGAENLPEFKPGDVVEDRYRVVRTIATGGMGIVYEVERMHDGQRLALKVALGSHGLELARLAREAQLATRMRHPNLVAVVDADVAEAGYVYLVMEFVEGCNLAEIEGSRSLGWSLAVLAQILRGLEALHAEGIIHRDLKPANVLLAGDIDDQPEVKITDFGISRGLSDGDSIPSQPPPGATGSDQDTVRVAATSSPDVGSGTRSSGNGERSDSAARNRTATPQLTRPGAIAGTPTYIAPELARRGASLSPAVDVFSFGVLAYQLLTGKGPHREAPLHARIDGREPEPHVPLGSSCPELPAGLAALLDACLASLPGHRPDITELLREIEGAAPEVPELVGSGDMAGA